MLGLIGFDGLAMDMLVYLGLCCVVSLQWRGMRLRHFGRRMQM